MSYLFFVLVCFFVSFGFGFLSLVLIGERRLKGQKADARRHRSKRDWDA